MRPADWPRYMIEKPLAGGKIGYYWNPHDSVLPAGCPLKRAALQGPYEKARDRANELNGQLDHWNLHGRLPDDSPPPGEEIVEGTMAHLFALYKAYSPKKKRSYESLPDRTRKDYDRHIRRILAHPIEGGGTVAGVAIDQCDTIFADALYEALLPGADGKDKRRYANLSMAVCGKAWWAAHRSRPDLVPEQNPFRKMGLDHAAAETKPATYDELLAFEEQALKAGEPVLAFAARAPFELLVRVEEVVLSFAWNHWRPAGHPQHVFLGFNKTNNPIWKRVAETVEQPDGSLKEIPFYPELEAHLEAIKKAGLKKGALVCVREHRKGPKPQKPVDDRPVFYKAYTYRYLAARAAEIRIAAGLPAHVTLTAFRHGGMTECGNGGLSDSLTMALSRHRQRETVSRYIHRTDAQDLKATKLRLAHRRESQR